MSVVYPTAAGAYSTRTWYDDSTGAAYTGGTPQVGDSILLNGKNITLDQNISGIVDISNAAGTNAIVGGTLTISTGGYICNLSGDVICNGTSNLIVINHTTGGHTEFSCRYLIMTYTSLNYGRALDVLIGSGNTCNINIKNISYTYTGNSYAISYNSTGNVTTTIQDTLKPTLGVVSKFTLAYSNNGGYILNANIAGEEAGTSYLNGIVSSSASNLIINGNITGTNVVGGNYLISTSGNLTINGTVTGGNTNYSIVQGTNSVITILQKTKGGTGFYAISTNQPTATVILDDVEAGTVPAVYSTVVNDIRVYGDIINKNGIQAIFAPKVRIHNSNTQIQTYQDLNNADRNMSTDLIDVNPANEADVRKDTIYGSTNQFTGTLIVPPKSAVLKDIPTDDGIGTLVNGISFTVQDIWNEPLTGATANSVKEKLVNTASGDEVGNIISSYNV